jgi:hypothetical protein
MHAEDSSCSGNTLEVVIRIVIFVFILVAVLAENAILASRSEQCYLVCSLLRQYSPL